MISLAFTGTQLGMTSQQRMAVYQYLLSWKPKLQSIHHGGCVGADEEFHELVWDAGLIHLVEVHPCTIIRKRAILIKIDEVQDIHPAEEPLDRNHTMVDRATHLLATPHGYEEVTRSGTWATIRYARKQRLDMTIILPNGETF